MSKTNYWKEKNVVVISLLLIIIVCCLTLVANLSKIDCNIYCTDRYGFMNAVNYYNDFCESNDMWFIYVTQGNMLRCENLTTVVFYNITFVYHDEIPFVMEDNI